MIGVGRFLVVLGGAVSLGVALWGYFVPLTGVSATVGALLAAFGGAAIILGTLIDAAIASRALHVTLMILLLIAILCTGLAGHFLLLQWIWIAALVALVGWVLVAAASITAREASA